ncbi:MAG: hypothetical protein KDC34_19455 [Saprospiraceae bacterium]|nr:hypothetical protein [Saprospiraceae bacterium]
MRIIAGVLIIGFLALTFDVQGQEELQKGVVTFLTSTNVYIKFESTLDINLGDTLFIQKGGTLTPALIVSNKSSVSCVCISLLSESFNKADEVFAKSRKKEKVEEADLKEPPDPFESPEGESGEEAAALLFPEDGKLEPEFAQDISGRFSISSYNNYFPTSQRQRLRYTLSLKGNHISNSRFSAETYANYNQPINQDPEQIIRPNTLRVYSLAVKYDIDSSSFLCLGRKINPKISNMGAIDGLQYGKSFGAFHVGALVGSRPDYSNYGVNFNLLQGGAFVSYGSTDTNTKYHQSTLGVVQQMNHFKTDRRFLYFQHSNMLVKNLNVFTSFELDLFENVNENASSTLRLTNFFISTRYRFSRKLSLSLSYDSRQGVIYYETFKSYIDNLIDKETRQGIRLNVNYRPFKYVSWGVNSSWRFQKSDLNVSRNINSYVTISRVPLLKMSVTLNGNYLQTNYLDSWFVGVKFSKDIIPKILSGGGYYRLVNYQYKNYEYAIMQNIVGANLSLRLFRNFSLHLYYEGTIVKDNELRYRINAKVIQRF